MLITVWIITCVIIIVIGIKAGGKITTSKEWSGGDRILTGANLAVIYGGFQIGGMAIVGAAQDGYNLGISGAWYSLAGSFYLIFLAVFAKLLRENIPTETLSVYLRNRFGSKNSRLYSYAWIIYGFLYIPMQLFALSSIIKIAIPSLNTPLAILLGLTVGVFYTSLSGMRGASAVGRVVCIGIYILLIGFVAVTVPKLGGFSTIIAKVPSEFGTMTNMPKQRIIAWIIGGCLSSAVMQAVLQPLLSAKDPQAARNGAAMGYLIAAPISTFTAFIGMLAVYSNADLGNGATAFAWSIKNFSHPIFSGIVFGFATLIIAATMSTMMLATGTIITDVYKTQINPDADDKKILWFSKISTFVFSYLTLIPALLISSTSINQLFLTLQHVAAAPISFSIFAGILWKRCTKEGSFWSMALGMLTGVIWMATGLVSKLEAVYPVILVSYGAGIIVSLMTSKEEVSMIK